MPPNPPDHVPAVVPVQDSKDPGRGAVLFGLGAWARFVSALERSGTRS
ncbi:DUF397 domain-containing protein [Streptomyces sp. AK04-3B]|nr:DUF397 domain-containing protein [Streptomyces sp. AK04-3B]MDX3800273.1 DUF397 domain-containing protein [Streptomyces sp. AK04-3B]